MTCIDLKFPVTGVNLPADHNYGLFSAIATNIPECHDLPWQLNTITGRKCDRGLIRLGNKSRLTIRCSPDLAELFSGLGSQSLRIGTHSIELGYPIISPLSESSILKARIVVIKGAENERSLYNSLRLRLPETAKITIGDRRTIKVKRFTVVGFGVTLTELSPSESLKLQSEGLGGKKRMGGGFLFF